MNRNLKLVVNNISKVENERYFFEKKELKVILDLYAKMVSEGSWKDYGLSISSKQVSFMVFKNAAENAIYKICKNFKPISQNLKYIITDSKIPEFAQIKKITKIRPKLSTTGGTSDLRFIKAISPGLEFGLVGKTMHKVDEAVSLKDLKKCRYITVHANGGYEMLKAIKKKTNKNLICNQI